MMRLPAVILAGGLATRMGGGDKALLRIGGTTLLGHVIARLVPQAGAMAISANGDAARFAGYGLPVLSDATGPPRGPSLGPLAGVLAGLDWAAGLGAERIVTVAADTPFLPPDLVSGLIAAAGSEGLATATSRDAAGRARKHPVFGLWPVALRDVLREDMAAGLRKVGLFAQDHGAGLAAFAGPVDPFFNVNTPDDLARAAALFDAL